MSASVDVCVFMLDKDTDRSPNESRGVQSSVTYTVSFSGEIIIFRMEGTVEIKALN